MRYEYQNWKMYSSVRQNWEPSAIEQNTLAKEHTSEAFKPTLGFFISGLQV